MGQSDALLLGIDIGTSGCKTVVVDEEGSLAAWSYAEYDLYSDGHGRSEQEPADWWNAVQQTIRDIMHRHPEFRSRLRGIGLSGQMHGLVPLDEHHRVIRRSILWNDQRSEPQCATIHEKAGGLEGLVRITNNRMLPGYTGGKILWLRENEPENYQRMKWFLNPKDYIRLCLTGDLVTEVSDASGTGLFDVRRRVWASELFSLLDLPIDIAPRCVESPEITGTVRPEVASELGLPPGLPVVGGGGDAVIQTIGSGVLDSSTLMTTIGTAGIVCSSLDEFRENPEGKLQLFCNVIPGKWHVMGVTLAAGASLQWARRLLFGSGQSPGVDVYQRINEEAAQAEPGSGGVIFLPYLSGERCPYPDPNARGSFIGLSMNSTRADLLRSVMEGVIFSFRDVARFLDEMGIQYETIVTSGGGAQSAVWRQIHADVFKKDVLTVNASREGAAYGAALVAGVGTGVWPSLEAIVQRLAVETRTQPQPQHFQRYDAIYEIYRKQYERLKPTFDELAAAFA